MFPAVKKTYIRKHVRDIEVKGSQITYTSCIEMTQDEWRRVSVVLH